MWRLCILLLCWTRSACALGLRNSKQASPSSAVEVLQKRAAHLQEELSSMLSDPDGGGVKRRPSAKREKPPTYAVRTRAASPMHRNWFRKAVKTAKKQAAAIANAAAPETYEKEDSEHSQDDTIADDVSFSMLRPNAGKKTDVITFGLFPKAFYGVNLKTNSFIIDVVITLKWVDERVKALIPQGATKLTLSKQESERKMWLPGIAITNRDIGKYDLISTSVVIHNTGEVVKVERSTATCKTKYILNDFPLDSQKLQVVIASTKYMFDEVVLKPDTDPSIKKYNKMFKGGNYDLKAMSVDAKVFRDVTGSLKKSRGMLAINVERDLDKYEQSHVIPSSLILMVSFGVSWFPFSAPFITPRLVLSVMSLMTFLNLSLSSNSALPPGAPFNWNDCINQTLLMCMFLTLLLTIFAEICMHTFKLEELARSVNHENKAMLPFVSFSSLAIILLNIGPDGYLNLVTTSYAVKIWIVVTVGIYIAWNCHRVPAALIQKRKEEEAKAATKK